MRVAVLSDIHGFNLAFETVLADIDQQGPFDEIVVAGDLCETGPGPREVLELIWSRDLSAVQGNTDLAVVEYDGDDDDRRGLGFVRKQIGSAGIAYLAALPFSHRITPPGGTGQEHDLLVVHANPSNMDDPLWPELDDREVRNLIGDTVAKAIAFGHLHVCYTRQVDDILLVDVSSVGNAKDGDLRCKYGILTWDESSLTWTAAFRRLPYPLEETEAQIRASDLPKPEKTIRKLREASYPA